MSEWDEVPYTEYLDVSEAGRYSINVSVFLRLIRLYLTYMVKLNKFLIFSGM